MERFLYHVLPKHFHRIRYYGFLANGKAGTNIKSIRKDLAVETSKPEAVAEESRRCPHCEQGTMITILISY
ncbi:MAG: transposase [Desulfotignum sp.]|nr:transposase [Desulfotignum sp.]